MRLLDWLDELDRRVIPERWRGGTPASERTVRRFLRAFGGINVVIGAGDLAVHDWLGAALGIAIGLFAIISSRPFARWAIERHASNDHR